MMVIKNQYPWMVLTVVVCLFVSLLISLQAGVFLLFFAIVGWWVWQHPEEGFLFFIIIAPLLPMLKITQTIGTVTIIKDVIILVLFWKLFGWPLLTRRLPYRRNILIWPVIGLLLWTGIETLRADSLLLGILRARDIVLYLMLYLAVLYLPHDAKRMQSRLQWLIASLLVVLGLGIYQWLFAMDSAVLRFDPVREIWIPRISSIMAHPSILGQYLVAAVTLLAAATFYLSGWRRFVLGALAVIALPFIFLTYSRAVWFGLAAAGSAMAAVWLAKLVVSRTSKKNLGKPTAITGVLVAILLLLMLKFTPAGVFLRSAFDPTYASNEERIEFLARLVAPMTNREALVGKGLGDVLAQNFREVDLEAFDLATGSARAVQLTKNRTLVDNQHLKTFVEMGLAGLLIYGWTYWVFWRKAWGGVKAGRTKQGQILGLAAGGFLAAFVVQGFFIDIWDIFPTNAMFWVLAGLVSAGD